MENLQIYSLGLKNERFRFCVVIDACSVLYRGGICCSASSLNIPCRHVEGQGTKYNLTQINVSVFDYSVPHRSNFVAIEPQAIVVAQRDRVVAQYDQVIFLCIYLCFMRKMLSHVLNEYQNWLTCPSMCAHTSNLLNCQSQLLGWTWSGGTVH